MALSKPQDGRWFTTVAANDQISFVINRRGDNACDSTYFDPAVSYASFSQASSDFSSTQGQGNWYYLDSTGAQMNFVSANNWWQGAEAYNLNWSSGSHPGNNADAVRQWRAPQAGTVRIMGSAGDENYAAGDGVIVSITKGATVLWQQTINNGNTFGFSFDVTTTVAVGDQINFIVNKRSSNDCDSTFFDPTIVYTSNATAQIHWLVTDQLGTPRMVFDQSGSLTVLDQNGNYASGVTRHDYIPFGEELFAGTGGRTTAQGYSASDGVRQKFTQKERDNETGLDYFLARYYGSTQGRFTSPDAPFADQSADNPQSWNLYSYVRNNPLVMIDPSGRRAGDYYDRDGVWQFTDNINDNKVYVVDICHESDGSVNYVPHDLGITHTQFKIIANIVRQEGTSTDPQEYLWIAHASHNEATATNRSLYDLLQTGFSSAPRSVKTNGIATTDASVRANAARAGVADVLSGGADPTGGARRWDGTDFLARGTSQNKLREFSTIDIDNTTYNTYEAAQRARWGNSVHFPSGNYEIPAAVFTDPANRTANGDFHYVTGARNVTQTLTATGARGQSIFWRIN